MSGPLAELRGDCRAIWSDADVRRAAFEELVHAAAMGGDRLARALARIDGAVVEGLERLALPRGPIRGVVQTNNPNVLGRKDPSCTFEINSIYIARFLRGPRGTDSILRTWVHESLHGRRPYAEGHLAEYRRAPGYEEGLAEGLAQIVARRYGGLDPPSGAYDYYAAVYRSLASSMDIEIEQLLRALWRSPTGRVRHALPLVMDNLRRTGGYPPMTGAQLRMLQARADTMFDQSRGLLVPNELTMEMVWKTVLR